MGSWSECARGHKYLQYDVPDDDVWLGAPACPYCRNEWYRQRFAQLARVTVKEGDVLVFRFEGAIPPQEVARIHSFVNQVFPECKPLVLQQGAQLTVVSQEDD